jgi:hypothetical protein
MQRSDRQGDPARSLDVQHVQVVENLAHAVGPAKKHQLLPSLPRRDLSAP